MFDDFPFATRMSDYLNWLSTSDVLGELAEYNTGLGSYIGSAKLTFDTATPPPPPGGGSLEQCLLDCFQAAGYSINHPRHKKRGVRAVRRMASRIVTDAQIQDRLTIAIRAADVPRPDPDNMALYTLFMPSGMVVDIGQDASCQTFCGYHDSFTLSDGTPIYYAVLPYPDCAGCTAGLAPFDALTAVASHEVCEAVTDPVPGTGWYDDQNGEVGDICAWKFRQDGGYNVQLEWSNKGNSCI